MRHEELKPGDGGSKLLSRQVDRSGHSFVATHGQANVRIQSVSYTRREAKATAADQGAPIRCSAWPVNSKGQTLYLQMRSKMEADLDKEWWVCLALPFTMGSLGTLARQEA